MRVLVTGGAGFIGSHSVEALLAEGHEPVVIDDLSTGHARNLTPGVRLIRASILDARALAEAIAGCETVLHLAAIVSVPLSLERPLDCHAVNATGSLQVLEAAHRAGVRRVVQASSAAVYGEVEPPIGEFAPLVPLSPYGLQKRMAEEYGRLYGLHHGLEVISLRYFNVYGPRQDPRSPYSGVLSRFADALARGEPTVIFGDGQQTRDFVFVGDVARANLLALTAPGSFAGEAFNLGAGRAISVLEAHAAIRAAVARESDTARPGGAPAHLPLRHEPARSGDIRHSLARVDAARERLGWQARVPFGEGISRTVHHAIGTPVDPASGTRD